MSGRAFGCFTVMLVAALSASGCAFEEGESENVAETSAAARARKVPSVAEVRRARVKLRAATNKAKDAKARARALGRDGTERRIERTIRRLAEADDIGGRIEQLISSLRGLRPNDITSIGQGPTGEGDHGQTSVEVGLYNDTVSEEQREMLDAQRALQGQAETARLLNELGGVVEDIGDAIIPGE